MANVLVVCATHRDRRELTRGSHDHRFFWHEYASDALEDLVAPRRPVVQLIADPLAEVDRLIALCRAERIDAVVSTDDYPGSTLAAIVADALDLPGPPPAVNLLLQHKYHCRVAQQRIRPDAVPPFALVDCDCHIPFAAPLFVKPVKSFFSVGAVAIQSETDWADVERAILPRRFFEPFDRLLNAYGSHRSTRARAIAEGLLTGAQVTVEGYACDGRVRVLGIVDSVMHPGTIAFERFEYPTSLPMTVQRRMEALAADVLHGVGYVHGMFNIEMMYDSITGALHVIEVNPRMSSQFADLFEKVDGSNTYELLLDLAFGREPTVQTRVGRHPCAASCVLRTFEDAWVARVPSDREVMMVAARYPDVRIEVLTESGKRLSEQMQDSCSFRYGIISAGGSSRRNALERAAACEHALRFEFRRQFVRSAPRPEGRSRRSGHLPACSTDRCTRRANSVREARPADDASRTRGCDERM